MAFFTRFSNFKPFRNVKTVRLACRTRLERRGFFLAHFFTRRTNTPRFTEPAVVRVEEAHQFRHSAASHGCSADTTRAATMPCFSCKSCRAGKHRLCKADGGKCATFDFGTEE